MHPNEMSDFVDFPPERSRKFLHLLDELDASMAAYIIIQKRPVNSFVQHILNTGKTDHEEIRLLRHQDFYESEYAFEVDRIIDTLRKTFWLNDNQLIKGEIKEPTIPTTNFILWGFKRSLLDYEDMLLEDHIKFWFLNGEVITLDQEGILVISEFIKRGHMKLSQLRLFMCQNQINGFPDKIGHSEDSKINFVLPKSVRKTGLIEKVPAKAGHYEINNKAEMFRYFNHGRSGKHTEPLNL